MVYPQMTKWRPLPSTANLHGTKPVSNTLFVGHPVVYSKGPATFHSTSGTQINEDYIHLIRK